MRRRNASTLSIEMNAIFYGFIRNCAGLGLRTVIANADWTHKILGLYSRFGQILDCYVLYEWKSLHRIIDDYVITARQQALK